MNNIKKCYDCGVEVPNHPDNMKHLIRCKACWNKYVEKGRDAKIKMKKKEDKKILLQAGGVIGVVIFLAILWAPSDDLAPKPRMNSDLEDTQMHCGLTADKILRDQPPMEDSRIYRKKLFDHCMESNGH